MMIRHYQSVQPIDVKQFEEAAEGVTVRRVISDVDGAENFTMEIFQVGPGGHTPYHSHPWEHEVFVIAGRGICRGAEGEKPFGPGDVIYVAPNEPHEFQNTGAATVEFVCVVPKAALTSYYLLRSGRDRA